MPFTGSHPAAVLPLMRSGLVPSALVIGSMAPDLPYYLPVPLNSGTTHSAPGVLGLDLLLGAMAFALWQVLVAPLMVAVAPPSVRARLAPGLPVPWRRHVHGPQAVMLVVVSLWTGSATHVLWDEFTHIGRWGYRHLPWLAQTHGSLPGYEWAQYGSGVFGALVIADSLRRWWRTTSPADPSAHPQRVPGLSPAAIAGVWTVIVLATLTGAAAAGGSALLGHPGVWTVAFRIATWGGGAGMFAVLACAVVHPRLPRDQADTQPTS